MEKYIEKPIFKKKIRVDKTFSKDKYKKRAFPLSNALPPLIFENNRYFYFYEPNTAGSTNTVGYTFGTQHSLT